MNEEKLPKELPLVASKYWDAFDLRKLQRDADQLLYDVLWAENEGLKAEFPEAMFIYHDVTNPEENNLFRQFAKKYAIILKECKDLKLEYHQARLLGKV